MRPALSRITVLMLSPIEPKCTGMCGALAINSPCWLNSAQEKSRRSLMFTECAVFCNCKPICSAIFMNKLLNTSSITGSTEVPAAWRVERGAMRSSTKWCSAVNLACQPVSMTVVAWRSTTSAGPATTSPACISSRRIKAASCQAPCKYMREVVWGGMRRLAGTGCTVSGVDSPDSTTSTDTASTTKALSGMRKAKRLK